MAELGEPPPGAKLVYSNEGFASSGVRHGTRIYETADGREIKYVANGYSNGGSAWVEQARGGNRGSGSSPQDWHVASDDNTSERTENGTQVNSFFLFEFTKVASLLSIPALVVLGVMAYNNFVTPPPDSSWTPSSSLIAANSGITPIPFPSPSRRLCLDAVNGGDLVTAAQRAKSAATGTLMDRSVVPPYTVNTGPRGLQACVSY